MKKERQRHLIYLLTPKKPAIARPGRGQARSLNSTSLPYGQQEPSAWALITASQAAHNRNLESKSRARIWTHSDMKCRQIRLYLRCCAKFLCLIHLLYPLEGRSCTCFFSMDTSAVLSTQGVVKYTLVGWNSMADLSTDTACNVGNGNRDTDDEAQNWQSPILVGRKE